MKPADADAVLDALGRRIAELREAAGMTQAEVAEALGTTVPNYQRVEHGFQNLTVKTMVRIAAALHVRFEALFRAPQRPHRPRGRPRPAKRQR